MPQSRERKLIYNRDRQRRLRGFGGECERGVVPNVVPPFYTDVVPWEVFPFIDPRSQSQMQRLGYMQALNRRGYTLALTSRGFELVNLATGQLGWDTVSPLLSPSVPVEIREAPAPYEVRIKALEERVLELELREALEGRDGRYGY